MKTKYDVIIVGAGPAGTATAIKIAAEGYQVLILDKASFPRTKSCGDRLTRTATETLYDLGLQDDLLSFKRVTKTKITVNKKGSRTYDYPDYMSNPKYGLVVPRAHLDDLLLKHAIGHGAYFKGESGFDRLIYKNKKVVGVVLESGETFYGNLIVGADGAMSNVAYQAGLEQTPIDKIGVGIRGYYKTDAEVGETLQLFLPILDHSNKRVLPSYGWVFPIKPGIVNIGIGLVEKHEKHDIETILGMFITSLKAKEPQFQDLELQGDIQQGAMRFDFKPERCYAPGLVLVGDAAGMVNPFTGEGVGYALETGTHAANVFLELKKSGEQDFTDLSKYGEVLASKYQGYFEAGTASINRYHLIWKVLKGTFQNDNPLFNAIRQATVFPEGVNTSFFNHYTENVKNYIPENQGQIRTDILTIGQNLIELTREDWPFLSHIFTANQITRGIPFRPSLLVLIAGYDMNVDNRDQLIQLGTAIELGLASTVCHNSVSEDINDDIDSMNNWGNMIAILTGDYLLSKSFDIVAPLEHRFTHVISEAVGKSNEGTVLLKNALMEETPMRMEDLVKFYALKNTDTFELCLHLGSMVKLASRETINALKTFGKHYGVAYFLTEDLKGYFNENDLEKAALRTLEQQVLKRMFSNKGEAFSLGLCLELINRELEHARKSLLDLGDSWAAQCLSNLCCLIEEKQELINLKVMS